MTTRAVYVLETRWTWDNINVEYGTITVEEPDDGFELLLDPKCGVGKKEVLLDQLRKVADGLDRSIMGKGAMVALYRISGPDNYKWVQKKNARGKITLVMHLTPVCGFDQDGNPVPIKKSSIKVPVTGVVNEGLRLSIDCEKL